MRQIATAGVMALAFACGEDSAEMPDDSGDGDDSSEETGGAVGDGDGDDVDPGGDGDGDGDDGAAEPICRTLQVANPAAGEKINAAYCFGLAYPDDAFACSWYPTENAVECLGELAGYVVLFTGDDIGDVYDVTTEEHLATVIQGATGAFELAWDTGEVGECTVVGDVATLCVELP